MNIEHPINECDPLDSRCENAPSRIVATRLDTNNVADDIFDWRQSREEDNVEADPSHRPTGQGRAIRFEYAKHFHKNCEDHFEGYKRALIAPILKDWVNIYGAA